MALTESLPASRKPRDSCESRLGSLSISALYATIAFPFCCGHLLLMPMHLQGGLLYPESRRTQLLSSFLKLPSTLSAFFPLSSLMVRIRPKERRSGTLVLPFTPLLSLPPAPPPPPEGGRAVRPAPGRWRGGGAAFLALLSSFPLFGLPPHSAPLPWGMAELESREGCREHDTTDMKNTSV